MRLTDAVFTTAPLKKFTNYKNLGYKYKVIRVPALKDEVKSRKMVVQRGECVNEMTRMMDCWKRTDFTPNACGPEIEIFLKCTAASKEAAKEQAERAAKGLPAKGSTLRPSKQVNEMLARYPQPETNLK